MTIQEAYQIIIELATETIMSHEGVPQQRELEALELIKQIYQKTALSEDGINL